MKQLVSGRSSATRSISSLLVTAFVVSLLLAVQGCDSGSTSDTSSKLHTKTYVIAVIAKSESNPVFRAARTGALNAANELGPQFGADVRIDWRTPFEEDALNQVKFMEALISEGVDGIAISCSDADLVTPAINEAVNHGIEVVTFDSDAPESARFAYYGVDDYKAGKEVMSQLAREMGGTGKVAILAGNQTAPNLQARVRGVEEELKNHSGIDQNARTYYHAETADEAVATMAIAQADDPNITGWALLGGWPLFAENALDDVYETAKVVSMDPLPEALKYVKEGKVQVLVGQPYYGWGYVSVKLLLNKLAKDKAPDKVMNYSNTDFVTAETVDEYERYWDLWLGKQ